MDSAAVRPNDIQKSEDLSRITPSTKEEIRTADPATLLNRRYARKQRVGTRTTGSTGVPIKILKTHFENRLFQIMRLRSMKRIGYRPTWKVVRIGLERPLGLSWQILSRLGLFQHAVVPMTLSPARIAKRLLTEIPDVVIGLPTILAYVSREIRKRDQSVKMDFAVSGGELLTPGLQRQIETVFSRVLNFYSSIEAQHPIAVECAGTEHLHVNEQGVILEILGENGHPVRPGERGEVVLTSLLSFLMPIIRYRMGDLAIAGPLHCPCGKPGRTIRSLEGRKSDYFRLPGGERFLAIQAAHIVQRVAEWILQ
jgi:phenylacetate-CoA ligase